jgi:DNA polymerase III epsilon subunit-like protein
MTISTLLLLDTETTSLDPTTGQAIEVAVTLYDVASACPLESYASLIRADRNEAEHVNGIPVAALAKARPADFVWAYVDAVAVLADAVVAHQASFDRAFVPAHVASAIPWICSKDDLLWPRALREGDSLVNLVLAHGLGIGHAHRAAADTDMLARLFTRTRELGTDLQTLLARGLRPKALFAIADRSFNAERNALAKELRFRWEADKKMWTKVMAKEDAAKLPFDVVEVAP